MKLRTWWQSLPSEEKERVCTFDVPTIMSDLANAANNALVVCKLNNTYKKKEIISWTKLKGDDGAILSQTFEFNLKGKELLDNCLAELFSCFYIVKTGNQQKQANSSNGENPAESHKRFLIAVKKEKLDCILDLLSHVVPNFGEGQKFLFQRKDFLELYSYFINSPTQNVPSLITLPPYIQALFERLYAFSSILEYQINLVYFEQVNTVQTKASLVSPRFNTLSTIINEFESMKAANQLGKENPPPEPIGDQNSTASGSPGNPIILDSTQNINMEELSQKLLQKATKENSQCSLVRELSGSFLTVPKSYDELNYQSSYTSPSLYFGNDEQDQIIFIYEGCIVGDLQISFDPTDAYLIGEAVPEETRLNEEECGLEERGLANSSTDEIEDIEDKDLNEKEEEKNDHQNEHSEDLTSQNTLNSSYSPNGSTNYSQSYSQQQFFYSNVEYYSQQYPQQYNYKPYNYGASNMYVSPVNGSGSMLMNTNYQQLGYSTDYNNNIQAPGKKSSNFQSNYVSETDNYPTQNYRENSKNQYEGQLNETVQEEKSHFYSGRDRSRYDARPKLPPRFQRMKDNVYRT